MEDKKISSLETYEKAAGINEFKWYIFDIIDEVLKQDGIEKNNFSLDSQEPDAVCLFLKDGALTVCSKAVEDSRQHADVYHAVCDFFYRLYQEEEKAEKALTRFLIRTLDLPVLTKIPSRSKVKDQISRCLEEISHLEEKFKNEPVKKTEAILSLKRVYLKGLNEKLKKYYGEIV